MLGVGDGVAHHVVQEALQDLAHLLVDVEADALDAASAGQSADGGLGDALNVVTQNLPVALGTALAETLATLAACLWKSVMFLEYVMSRRRRGR